MRRIPFEQRQEELVDAAVRVIARDGLAAASARAIVAEAKMPLGAFNYVFESRDKLLRTLISQVVTIERAAVLSALEAQKPSTIEGMLRAGLLTYLGMLERAPESELAVAELSLYGARHDRELVAEQWNTYFLVAAESLQRGAELCGVSWTQPVEEIAQSLISVLDGLTLTWLTTRDTAAATRHIDFLARSFAALAVASAALPEGA